MKTDLLCSCSLGAGSGLDESLLEGLLAAQLRERMRQRDASSAPDASAAAEQRLLMERLLAAAEQQRQHAAASPAPAAPKASGASSSQQALLEQLFRLAGSEGAPPAAGAGAPGGAPPVAGALPGALAHRDGEHSGNPGPCQCGQRHWFQGREVDFVTRIGQYYMGFDQTDNPLLVARDFVDRNNLDPNTIDNSKLVTRLAEMIREHQNSKGAKEASVDVAQLVDGARVGPYAEEQSEIIRPYGEAGGVRAVYNHTTGQVEMVHYAGGEGEDDASIQEKRRRRAADAKAKQEAELKQRDAQKEETLRRIQLMRADSQRPTFLPQPKSGAHQSRGGGGMATLRDLEAGTVPSAASRAPPARTASPEPRPPASPEEWTEAYALQRFRKVGPEGLKREMAESGFTPEQLLLAERRINSLMLMEMMMRGGMPPLESLDDADGGQPTAPAAAIKKPRQHVAAFEGHGHTLASSDGMAPVAVAEADAAGPDLGLEVVVDETQPTTQVRITVPGHAPLTATLNLTHTVAHLRRVVVQHAQLDHGRFHLQLLRPPTRLDDGAVTIEAAKLQRATITVVFREQ